MPICYHPAIQFNLDISSSGLPNGLKILKECQVLFPGLVTQTRRQEIMQDLLEQGIDLQVCPPCLHVCHLSVTLVPVVLIIAFIRNHLQYRSYANEKSESEHNAKYAAEDALDATRAEVVLNMHAHEENTDAQLEV